MSRRFGISALSIVIAGALAFTAAYRLGAQESTPDGYIAKGTKTQKGMAPMMRVTDLGKGARTFRVNLYRGDEIVSGLTEFAEKYHIRSAHFTGLGAIDHGLFGWTEPEKKLMKKIEINQEAEITALVGSISVNNQGQPNVHGHISVALSDGSLKGGHLQEARISLIGEIFVTEEEAAPAPETKTGK